MFVGWFVAAWCLGLCVGNGFVIMLVCLLIWVGLVDCCRLRVLCCVGLFSRVLRLFLCFWFVYFVVLPCVSSLRSCLVGSFGWLVSGCFGRLFGFWWFDGLISFVFAWCRLVVVTLVLILFLGYCLWGVT